MKTLALFFVLACVCVPQAASAAERYYQTYGYDYWYGASYNTYGSDGSLGSYQVYRTPGASYGWGQSYEPSVRRYQPVYPSYQYQQQYYGGGYYGRQNRWGW